MGKGAGPADSGGLAAGLWEQLVTADPRSTYRRLLEHLRPAELLGLTATPDRANGADIVTDFFDGRIAAELRLWDAIDGGYLVPFAYYGSHDGTDLSSVGWWKGGATIPQRSPMCTPQTTLGRVW